MASHKPDLKSFLLMILRMSAFAHIDLTIQNFLLTKLHIKTFEPLLTTFKTISQRMLMSLSEVHHAKDLAVQINNE